MVADRKTGPFPEILAPGRRPVPVWGPATTLPRTLEAFPAVDAPGGARSAHPESSG